MAKNAPWLEKMLKFSGRKQVKINMKNLEGINKNENGVAQVLEYSGVKLRNIGVFDGDSLRLTP